MGLPNFCSFVTLTEVNYHRNENSLILKLQMTFKILESLILIDLITNMCLVALTLHNEK